MASQSKRVAIIGAGPSGLVAIKECLAAGLTVQCFERAHALGGQWLYEPAPTAETHSSVYAGVILNSSRAISGFSDFPIDPARYPVHYSHRLHLRYLNEYAAHFGLAKHVRFNTLVVGCVQRPDGGWEVRVRSDNSEDGDGEEVLTFDAVVSGNGASGKPLVPEYEGRERFKGEVLHSHYYRIPSAFEGKKVVVVGLGPSAVDIACEVAPLAKELTIINRRGGWILPRSLLGKPPEAWNSRVSQWLPASVQECFFQLIVGLAGGKLPAELQPDHGITSQAVTIRSDFVEKLRTGVLSFRRSTIASFTETGVLLADGTAVEADALGTGYRIVDQPPLPPDVLASEDMPAPHVDLYKMVVSPRCRGLYVLGQTEQAGPANGVAEAQARFVAAVIAGRVRLPGEEEMMRDVRAFRRWQLAHLVDSERHAVWVEYVPYVDGLLAPLGAVPSCWKLLGRVWRLFGEGSAAELAEETVLRTDADAEELSEGEKAVFL
ncbi:uncharacterized protein GLRG_06592 [Colletotrichum graminicola M1.001]|uniref:Dimethylaniline monooxygenase n=1 Tax=Colletotrichum graminicola (strain M1.001 / M2 / FGSC 10212) TaxID=645133 RepID=E3QKR0_COLGM|nr:uncharacterized protein GLRG_06592 [Colletotrichum graminicola M1.001]EFQ31448.1 hypothetical protein GLRG_06592 [Colletotrichum graminicola M1.001]